MAAVNHWLTSFGINISDDESIYFEAIQWATGRGTRSGRTAWQFAQDYAGRKMMNDAEALSPEPE